MWHEYPYTDAHELNLDWFLKEFKTLVETWEQVQSDWNSLHDYVQNYFDNLNVQTEINNKINAMIADGSFALILTPMVEAALPTIVDGKLPAVVASQIGAVVASQIGAVVAGQLPTVAAQAAADEVGDWLATHIDPDTGYVIDDTLTVSNTAADAKTTGDRLNEVVEMSAVEADNFGIVGTRNIIVKKGTTKGFLLQLDLKNANPITINIKLASSLSVTSYLYLQDKNGNELFPSTSAPLVSGQTEYTINFNPAQDYDDARLKFTLNSSASTDAIFESITINYQNYWKKSFTEVVKKYSESSPEYLRLNVTAKINSLMQ